MGEAFVAAGSCWRTFAIFWRAGETSSFGARELQRGGFASAQRRFYSNRGDGARHRSQCRGACKW